MAKRIKNRTPKRIRQRYRNYVSAKKEQGENPWPICVWATMQLGACSNAAYEKELTRFLHSKGYTASTVADHETN